MKKLLVVSLVSVMMVVFSGVASTAAPVFWWESSAEITRGITLTNEFVNTAGNTVLVTKSATFKGFMVMETTAPTPGVDAGTINELFLCGTVTVGTKAPTDVEILFEDFALVTTDHGTTTKAEVEAGDIIAAGTFTDQTNTLVGPAIFNGKATFDETSSANGDTLTSMIVSGAFNGGYGQNVGKAGLFSATISTDLKPFTFTTGTFLACVAGVVVQQSIGLEGKSLP